MVPALQYDLQVTACDRRAVTYDHSEMHRLQADQAVQLLQPSPPEPAWRPALAYESLTRLNRFWASTFLTAFCKGQ